MEGWRRCGGIRGLRVSALRRARKCFLGVKYRKSNRTKEEKVGRGVNDGQGSEQAHDRVHYVTRIRGVA